uniref:Uncharacterized protein n=1 Tax=viral metagenome TaxID=1070528 RepID=A0A6M3LPQ7_9ZZZZ
MMNEEVLLAVLDRTVDEYFEHIWEHLDKVGDAVKGLPAGAERLECLAHLVGIDTELHYLYERVVK